MDNKLFAVYYGQGQRLNLKEAAIVLVARNAEEAKIKARPLIASIAPWAAMGSAEEARYVCVHKDFDIASADSTIDRNDLEDPQPDFGGFDEGVV